MSYINTVIPFELFLPMKGSLQGTPLEHSLLQSQHCFTCTSPASNLTPTPLALKSEKIQVQVLLHPNTQLEVLPGNRSCNKSWEGWGEDANFKEQKM